MGKKNEESKAELSVKLTIGERLLLAQLLPEKGPIATVRLVRDLTEQLSLTADEYKEHDIVQDGAQLKWSNATQTRTFTFSGFALELILSQLRKANEAGTLTAAHVPIWDKLIPSDAVV